jgi:GNAT superfamily N-acetyltransferase
MIIAPATPDDAAELGRVHVQAWREAYPGLVPDAVLAALDPAERAALWTRILATDEIVLLARHPAGAIHGFIAAALQREPGILPFAAEIGALYLLRVAQRQGLGRALMAGAARTLLARGLGSASLWVLDGNTAAIAFYTALGGRIVHQRPLPARRDWPGHETAYAWDDLRTLAG